MKRLEKHQTIAFDFDQTLIQNPYSHKLWEHVRDNPEKTYWVVTFRSHHLRDEEKLWTELEHRSFIDRSHFEGVHFVPDHLYNSRCEMFVEWKGKTAHSLGCTVLVDDIPEWTQAGAEKYGLEFIDPYTLGEEGKEGIVRTPGGIILTPN